MSDITDAADEAESWAEAEAWLRSLNRPMKYSEIHEALYGGRGTRTLGTLNLDLGRRLAWVAIRTLDGRVGFDYWWDSQETKDQDELFEELVSAFDTQPLLP